MNTYTSVKIPKVLADKIREVMIPLGYTSVSDFIIDATRRLLEKIEEKTRKIIQQCRWNEHNFKSILICSICGNSPQRTFQKVDDKK